VFDHIPGDFMRRFAITLILIMSCSVVAEAQQRQTGNSGFGGGGGATGGFGGTNQTGGLSTGGQQLGTTNLNSADGTLSAQVGQNAFVGGNNQGFVGNRLAGQQNAGTQGPQFGNLSRSTQRPTQQQQTNTQRKTMRPQYRVGFAAPPIQVGPLESKLQTSLADLPILKNRPGVQVNVSQSGVVSLSGVVASDHERKLLAAFVRLEPGVREVDNQLAVTP